MTKGKVYPSHITPDERSDSCRSGQVVLGEVWVKRLTVIGVRVGDIYDSNVGDRGRVLYSIYLDVYLESSHRVSLQGFVRTSTSILFSPTSRPHHSPPESISDPYLILHLSVPTPRHSWTPLRPFVDTGRGRRTGQQEDGSILSESSRTGRSPQGSCRCQVP